ncbi:MAG: bi-domain-containing oxidoreductase [Myxococcales bacterium]|nr:bi-domain-containing oxidoreductase [Myxococcales bacterium]
MKQIIQSYRSGELWLAEVPAPALAAGGVVVQTAASLVSAGTERMVVELAKKSLLGKARARPDLVKQVLGKLKTEGVASTLAKVKSKLDTPISLGYSSAGTVVEVGQGVTDLRVGQRVACAGAGYATHAEYNFVPRNLCVPLPDAVSFEDGCFTTLGAIALQGVRQADVRIGERVVVIGLGLLGLLTVQLLRACGCEVLGSDLDPERCRQARQLGAQAVVPGELLSAAEAFTAVAGGQGADAVVITAATPSNQPIETAAEVARVRGRVVVVGLVGMELPRDPFYKKELDLRLSMSYGPGRYDPSYEEGGHDYPFGHVRWTEGRNMQAFVELLGDGRVTPAAFVSHRFTIDRALEAYELFERGASDGRSYLGIVLQYPGAAEDAVQSAPPKRRVELGAARAGSDLGLGLIGAGNFARSVIVPTLEKLGRCQFRGVCTATGMSASHVATNHGFGYATTDPAEIFGDVNVDAVFVATRHDSHGPLALAALAAGKHVFVEKPLCIDPEQLAEIEAALSDVSDAGPKGCLMVGFNRRFSPHVRAMVEAFKGRTTPLAITYRINAGVIEASHWIQDPAVGGGRIVGEVCHFVDTCEALTGSAVVRVFAASVHSASTRVTAADSVVITLSHADGSLSSIQYLAHGARDVAKERIEAHADGITAICDDFRRTSFHGSSQAEVKGSQDKGFGAELQAFLDTVRYGGAWPIAAESLLRTTRATFAIGQSLRTGLLVDLG